MALTGELNWKGLAIPNAHVRVMNVEHRVVDNGSSKELFANYSARVYKDADARSNTPDQALYTFSGEFTPSVANSVNLNIVKQTYTHLKTLDTYKDLTDS